MQVLYFILIVLIQASNPEASMQPSLVIFPVICAEMCCTKSKSRERMHEVFRCMLTVVIDLINEAE
jgi:hypothetical protein